jgi:prepilin-type N-terminal cleavage/methylation domain-containing protein
MRPRGLSPFREWGPRPVRERGLTPFREGGLPPFRTDMASASTAVSPERWAALQKRRHAKWGLSPSPCGGTAQHPAFSLVELVIVVTILGLVAAIAVPRFSRASQGSTEAALQSDLKHLRHAIELYAVEHRDEWPALRGAGDGVGPHTGEAFRRHIIWSTNENHEAVETRDAAHPLGPYLRAIPPLPLGSNAGNRNVATTNTFSTPGGQADAGWEYEHYFGNIRANLPAEEIGSNGVPYYQW